MSGETNSGNVYVKLRFHIRSPCAQWLRTWSAEEARTFLETARHDRLYALWAVALAIGLRPR